MVSILCDPSVSTFGFRPSGLSVLMRSESPISRILFPNPVTPYRATIIHLGCRLPDTSCDLPGSSGGPPSNAPLFGLAPGGVYLASPVTRGTGALLPHRFTLTPPDGEAVCFLLHFPSRYRDSTLWSTLPCGVRTFLRVSIVPRDRLGDSDRSGFFATGRMYRPRK